MYTEEMIQATKERLYKLYRKRGVKHERAERDALWFAQNRAKHFAQGLEHAKRLGITGVAVKAGEIVSPLVTGLVGQAMQVAIAS